MTESKTGHADTNKKKLCRTYSPLLVEGLSLFTAFSPGQEMDTWFWLKNVKRFKSITWYNDCFKNILAAS